MFFSSYLLNCKHLMKTFIYSVPKILKGLIAVMIFITHALNFWVPFNLCFHYIRKRHNQNRLLMWELIYRAMIVVLIALVAIAFPSVNSLMGFVSISHHSMIDSRIYCVSSMGMNFATLVSQFILFKF